MDRLIVYPGAIPLDTDILTVQRNSLTGLGYALQAALGTGTLVDGLACTPTSPASMQIQVGAGAIYAQEVLDGSAFGSLAADTTDLIVKQGLNLPTQTFTLTAPTTSGQSITYLVEAAYQDVDGTPAVLTYYNASNPASAWSGPANSGATNNTSRKGVCALQVIAGVPAATGSQVAPAVTTGWTALYTVTVAYGQTSVTAANVIAVSGAPFITTKLAQLGALAKLNIGAGLVNDGAGNLALSATSYGVVGNMRNLHAAPVTGTTATWTWDETTVETALGGTAYRLTNTAGLTLNLGATGAGGMDTGSAPSPGWLGVYAIYNPSTGAKALLATDTTTTVAPSIYGGANMPAGFTASALISVVPTNTLSQICVCLQRDRKIWYSTTFVSATADGAYHTVSIAGSVPKNATSFDMTVGMGGASTGGNWVFDIGPAAGPPGQYMFGGYMQSGTGLYGPISGVPIAIPQTTIYFLNGGCTLSCNMQAYTF